MFWSSQQIKTELAHEYFPEDFLLPMPLHTIFEIVTLQYSGNCVSWLVCKSMQSLQEGLSVRGKHHEASSRLIYYVPGFTTSCGEILSLLLLLHCADDSSMMT